jgi:hypothetical protein
MRRTYTRIARPATAPRAGSGQIEAIQVHHLGSGGNEVTHEGRPGVATPQPSSGWISTQ